MGGTKFDGKTSIIGGRGSSGGQFSFVPTPRARWEKIHYDGHGGRGSSIHQDFVFFHQNYNNKNLDKVINYIKYRVIICKKYLTRPCDLFYVGFDLPKVGGSIPVNYLGLLQLITKIRCGE